MFLWCKLVSFSDKRNSFRVFFVRSARVSVGVLLGYAAFQVVPVRLFGRVGLGATPSSCLGYELTCLPPPIQESQLQASSQVFLVRLSGPRGGELQWVELWISSSAWAKQENQLWARKALYVWSWLKAKLDSKFPEQCNWLCSADSQLCLLYSATVFLSYAASRCSDQAFPVR